MDFVWLLCFGCFILAQASSLEVSLQGPQNAAQRVGKSVVLLCNIVQTDGEKSVKYDNPFLLNWTFTPVGSSTSRILVTWTYHFNKTYTNLTSHPEKYRNTNPVHLYIYNLQLKDAGSYGCWSNVTSGIRTAELAVVEIPSCRNENPEVSIHQNITLDCTVNFAGNVMPTMDWQHGSRIINSTKSQHNTTNMRAYLRMPAGESMNGHIYNCHVAYPGLYSVMCQALPAMKINVPAIVSQVWALPRRKLNVFQLGDRLELHCVARGYPAPQYTWYYAPLDNIMDFVRLTSNSYYKIENFRTRDQGIYKCSAVNEVAGVEYNDSRDLNITFDATKSASDKHVPYTIAEHRKDEQEVVEQHGELQSETWGQMMVSPYAIGALISAGLAILLIIVFVVIAMRMKKRERKMREKLSRGHDEMLDDQEVELLDESIQHHPEYMPSEYSKLRMSWEIPRRDIRLVEQIGKGSYVEVWKGRMRRQPGASDILRVAIKKLISDSTEGERRLFVSELEVMKMLPAHANIVRLIGSYTSSEPWLIMLEFTPEGTLQEYLQRHRPGQQEVVINHVTENQAVRLQTPTLDPHKLLALAAQICSGLDHLQRFKLIYYRLKSARVLVGKGGICKLSGFGFPQEVKERNLYEVSSAPVRWLAPECLLEKTYNVKTDVWAYGIVLWEILHFGMTPYPAMGPQEVLERVQTGYRMPQPQHCSPHLFNLMSVCWHGNPEDRPTYSQIIEALTELAQDHYPHIMFDKLPDYLKSGEGIDDTLS